MQAFSPPRRLFVPRRSDAHRIACLALYRALLRQCTELVRRVSNGDSRHPSTLQNVVRYRFRRDSKLQSPYQIQDALVRGHTHLSILRDATSGSAPALETLTRILHITASHADSVAAERAKQKEQEQQKPIPPLSRKARHILNETSPTQAIPSPTSKSLSSLPLPLSALGHPRRQVPYLNDAQNRIPILRWPGQSRYPVYISRIIRQKMRRVERAHEQIRDLEGEATLAEVEDSWDGIVQQQLERELGVDAVSEPSWVSTVREAIADETRRVRAFDRERSEKGKVLWDLVKKEQKMSDWETLPEKLVTAGKHARKLEYAIMRFAKRWSQATADKLWAEAKQRKELALRKEEELLAMPWVIKVEWVRNVMSGRRLLDDSADRKAPTMFRTLNLYRQSSDTSSPSRPARPKQILHGTNPQRTPGAPSDPLLNANSVVRRTTSSARTTQTLHRTDEALPPSHPRRNQFAASPRRKLDTVTLFEEQNWRRR